MTRPGKGLHVIGNRPVKDIWAQGDEALQQRMLKPRPDRLKCPVCESYVEALPTREKPCRECGDW